MSKIDQKEGLDPFVLKKKHTKIGILIAKTHFLTIFAKIGFSLVKRSKPKKITKKCRFVQNLIFIGKTLKMRSGGSEEEVEPQDRF